MTIMARLALNVAKFAYFFKVFCSLTPEANRFLIVLRIFEDDVSTSANIHDISVNDDNNNNTQFVTHPMSSLK